MVPGKQSSSVSARLMFVTVEITKCSITPTEALSHLRNSI